MNRNKMLCFYCNKTVQKINGDWEHKEGGKYYFVCSNKKCLHTWMSNEVMKVCPKCREQSAMLDHEVSPCTEEELYWENVYDV